MDDQQAGPTEAPRGMFAGKLDEKGRLRIPREVEKYLRSMPESKLFVTSLDRRIARIYPITIWRQNEKFFQEYRENPAAVRRVAFTATDLGADAEMDSNGRVLFPLELRRELGIEDANVRLCVFNGFILVYSEAEYAKMRQEASAAPENSVDVLMQAGLK